MNDNENKTNAPTINLLPCPFCGGEASMSNVGSPSGGDRYVWIVGCNNEECDVQFPGYARKVDAAKVWNTRNEADALRAEVEVYHKALQNLSRTVQNSSLLKAVWMGSGRKDAEVEQIVGANMIAKATLKQYAAIKPNAAAGEEGTDGK